MHRLNKSSQPGRIDARREFWSIWISLPDEERRGEDENQEEAENMSQTTSLFKNDWNGLLYYLRCFGDSG